MTSVATISAMVMAASAISVAAVMATVSGQGHRPGRDGTLGRVGFAEEEEGSLMGLP